MILDDESVILGEGESREMGRYDFSLPTGMTIGKRWLVWSRDLTIAYMGEFVPGGKRGTVSVRWRKVLEIVPGVHCVE